MPALIPVVLCGGSGSRLWPASRDSYPKQFLSLMGRESLFQATLLRVTGPDFGQPLVVTGEDYRFLVAEQMRTIGCAGDIVLEPMRRDSCAAIAAAAEIAVRRDPEAVVLVLAADHAIPDRDAFLAHVRRGLEAALAGRIVTFGMRPDKPATGYGYIRPGAALAEAAGVHRIEAFVEKPDAATAARHVEAGYLWNSGNFLFSARVFLDELDRLGPSIGGPVRAAVEGARCDLDFLRLDAEAFSRATARSIDYAVMEKTDRAAVVPSDFAWSDIGSWASLWELAERDGEGNAAVGKAVFLGTRNAFVHAPDILTAVIGLEDVVVVTTKDAVLVTARDRTEEVKTIVGQLAADKRIEATQHTMSYRPWGSFESIDAGTRYQVKRISVRPGGKLSMQSHMHRSEHWIVVSGTARVTLGDEVRLVTENQSIYVPLGSVHRLENPGHIPLELIEVQSGSYLGEDDIVRCEDVDDRA